MERERRRGIDRCEGASPTKGGCSSRSGRQCVLQTMLIDSARFARDSRADPLGLTSSYPNRDSCRARRVTKCTFDRASGSQSRSSQRTTGTKRALRALITHLRVFHFTSEQFESPVCCAMYCPATT